MKVEDLKPTGNRVLVRRDQTGGVTKGGIIIPESQYHDSKFCTVLAVGPGKWVDGKLIETGYQVGDRIIVISLDGDYIDGYDDPYLQIVDVEQIQASVDRDVQVIK